MPSYGPRGSHGDPYHYKNTYFGCNLCFCVMFLVLIIVLIISAINIGHLTEKINYNYICKIEEIINNCPNINIIGNVTIKEHIEDFNIIDTYPNTIIECNTFKSEGIFKCYYVDNEVYTDHMIQQIQYSYNVGIWLPIIFIIICCLLCCIINFL